MSQELNLQANELNETTNTAEQTPGSVDQIRDILFGQQMSEYEKRFQQLENQLVKENRALAEGLNKRIDAALHELEQERQERAAAFNDLIAKLNSQHEQLESARSFTERQLLDQLGATADQIEQQIREASEKETRRHGKIRSLFKELADNLNQEPQ